jgi:hypothetical protein
MLDTDLSQGLHGKAAGVIVVGAQMTGQETLD